jgi:prepilin-type N-terminal cleavage/methylation domain-containing protein
MTHRTPNSRRAFTLIELMVSIAMVLILILGVNAIFKMASDTINAGQALSTANQANLASTSVLYDDFRTAVINDGPMLLIRSERVAAFRNLQDEQSDLDYAGPYNDAQRAQSDTAIRTIDLDGNNKEGETSVRGELTGPLVYNSRNHRIDRVSFFSNQLYRRQTGTHNGAGVRFVDDGASNEAYIWYGHLDQPDPKSPLAGGGRWNHRGPGELPKTANPSNFYATDWILGRSVTLLREQPVPLTANGQPLPNSANYIDVPANLTQPSLAPLSPEAQPRDNDYVTGKPDLFSWSRYDLAKTSIESYKGILQRYIADPNVGGYDIRNDRVWYAELGGRWGNGGNSARFHGTPYPDKPLTPYGVSQTVPVFVRGCTQFMVEYAGDYLKQDPVTGAVIKAGTNTGTYLDGPAGVDGQIDYVLVDEVDPVRRGTVKVRRVRWYGMPRNVDTFDDTAAGPMIAGGLGVTDINFIRDVVPLRDVLLAAGATIPANFFEHFENLEPMQNYGVATGVAADPKALRYYAAWGPSDLAAGSLARPKMIRITMTVDDPNGRMSEGQTYEYIINLP